MFYSAKYARFKYAVQLLIMLKKKVIFRIILIRMDFSHDNHGTIMNVTTVIRLATN